MAVSASGTKKSENRASLRCGFLCFLHKAETLQKQSGSHGCRFAGMHSYFLRTVGFAMQNARKMVATSARVAVACGWNS